MNFFSEELALTGLFARLGKLAQDFGRSIKTTDNTGELTGHQILLVSCGCLVERGLGYRNGVGVGVGTVASL